MARKNFGLKNFFLSFAIVCIALYIFQNINGSVDIGVAENGNLEDVIRADGIIVKDEEVYDATLDGSVSYYYDDGTKIKEGQLVADLNTDTNYAQINKQISEIQVAIDLKNNSEGNAVEVLLKETLSSCENEIQASILNDDLHTMYNIVGQVDNNGMHTYSDGEYEGYDVNQLETLKSSLLSSVSTNKVPYYSNHAGIITYKIDGLEDVYKFENVLNITPSSTIKKEYTITDESKVETVVKNESIFKMIKNFEYYITATVDNEKAKLFEESKYIKTRIISEGSQHEVWGYIKKINYGSEESVLILYFDDYFYKIYDKRYVDLELITDVHEGLKINTIALTKVNGLTGVYVEDASNIIKFFPVEILGQDENNAIVSIGEYVGENERNQIYVADKGYSTIKIFDKIILEPEKVYEGQIAD
ncbi:MAG: HlyD family efflux transporter periplasmic adaptor subunit [Sedimentibacter sp.]|uniref:HlyD family efflux transporter periplasmic adaptor subunit n=1 Tax=Sedimentibacter sp. TaxID=1960295 RepID=UPI002980A608|nr:HlyD family efflux transporter periplasmic adaptor subunit [Sedimentibacter sp.]MDW5300580.1 HlyD family efflux transporter periplasmic adaptor subunit [Sedimentibacter sp.]